MKLCQTCGQSLAEQVSTCPSCGSTVEEGRRFIDDYQIITVLHEGYASLLCKAIRERTHEKVMIRLFTSQSGVDESVAKRLRREIEELKKQRNELIEKFTLIINNAQSKGYDVDDLMRPLISS